MKSIDDLISSLNARKAGPNEWRSCCPVHQGKNKNAFAITQASDGKILCHCFSGCDQILIGDYLKNAGYINFETGKVAGDHSRPPNEGRVPYKKYQGYDLKAIYKYPGGCFVGRYEKEVDGKIEKMTIPFFENGGTESGFPLDENYKRPLYSHFALSQKKEIFIVEGEKCVDACFKFGVPAITWPGGSKAVLKADWSAIKDKKVYIWPDNDDPGIECATKLKAILDSNNLVSICKIDNAKEGWDVADYIDQLGEDCTKEKIIKYFKNNEKIIAVSCLSDYMQIDAPPLEILLGFLHTNSINMIYSERGLGKSWFSMTLAYCLAAGKDFVRFKSNRRANVLYIDGEQGTAENQSRLFKIAESYGGYLPENFYIIDPDQNDGRIPKLSTAEGREHINEIVRNLQIEFIFIDNISTLIAGDQNDAQTWDPIQDWSIELKSKGVSTVWVDHAGKSATQRGTSAKQDSPQNIVYLSHPYGFKNKHEDQINGDAAIMQVDFEKTRSGIVDKSSFVAWLEKIPGDKGNLSEKSVWKHSTVEQFNKMRIEKLYKKGYAVAEIVKITGIYKASVEGILRAIENI